MMQSADDKFEFTPVVILGAARSGTNVLRDTLTKMEEFGTWPCDEINPIWRHGNLFWPDDQIPLERATPKIKKYIRRTFRSIWQEQGRPEFVVEKTCANTLRVPFVNAVLPDAKFIHIVRNGIDVVQSAKKRWRGELEFSALPYLMAKVKYAPWSDLPLYGYSFLRNKIAMLASKEKRMSVWGPISKDLNLSSSMQLEEVCARQWAACVRHTSESLEALPCDRWLQLKYEDFVTDPQQSTSRVLEFLGLDAREFDLAEVTKGVRSGSVGKSQTPFEQWPDHLRAVMAEMIEKFDYCSHELNSTN